MASRLEAMEELAHAQALSEVAAEQMEQARQQAAGHAKALEEVKVTAEREKREWSV